MYYDCVVFIAWALIYARLKLVLSIIMDTLCKYAHFVNYN